MASNNTRSNQQNTSQAIPRSTPLPNTNIATLVPMAVLIVLVNSFVLFLFATKKKLRTPSNYLLFSLAVSDLINGVVNIPLFLAFDAGPARRNRWAMLVAYQIFSKLTTASTAYHILVVTAEKYLAIVKPLRHHSSNPKNIFKCIGIVWLVSSVMAILPLAWYLGMPMPMIAKYTIGYDVFCFVTVFFLPYIFIVYAQTVMLRAIAKRSRKNGSLFVRAATARRQRKLAVANEKKCLCIFAAMAGLFLICWLPWFTLTFLLTMGYAVPSLHGKIKIPDEILRVSIIIRFCTSIVNPLLYTFFKRDFMQACKSVCCVFKRELSTMNSSKFSRSGKVVKTATGRPSKKSLLAQPNCERVDSTSTDEVVMVTCL